MTTRRFRALALFLLVLGLAACRSGGQSDTRQGELLLGAQPGRRVVSLSPAASEILASLGAADAVVGLAIHSAILPGLENKPLVGGTAPPDIRRILALKPDCVIADPAQRDTLNPLRDKGIPLFFLQQETLASATASLRALGALVGREQEAEALISREQNFAILARDKAAKLARDPAHKALRTLRILEIDETTLRVPGDATFHNELIRNAGGETPAFGIPAPAMTLTPQEWRALDPEVVYFCGQDAGTLRRALAGPAWTGVRALENGKIFSYPCDLVDRPAAHHGYASLWLSSDMYGDKYSDPKTQVTPDAVVAQRSLDLPFTAVATAKVLTSRLFDVPAKTLVIRFTEPQTVLSSLSGWQHGILAVGNHYSAPPSWAVTHSLGLEKANARTLSLLGLAPRTSALLYTGADMDNLAYAERSANGLRVGVLATAGVAGNAMRAPVDEGRYVEAGTINILVITNRTLTPAAMSRALITATEAKTAALEDLDIRSSYSALPATGTGTDNVLVISGKGSPATMTGGHTKLGELMAKAVYAAVREAVARQNHLLAQRNIFQRLAERGLVPSALPGVAAFLPDENARRALGAALEQTLVEPRYAGFMAGALTLADTHERGLLPDTTAFSTLCLIIAGELAGGQVTHLVPLVTGSEVPPLLQEALNALATGLLRRQAE